MTTASVIRIIPHPAALCYGFQPVSPIAQAGALAVRRNGSDVEVLVARSKKNPREWIFPKGHIEAGESAADAAIRELQEETGVVGEVVRPIGVSTFWADRGEVEITYFLVRFIRTGPPAESRQKRWVAFDEAKRLITFPDGPQLIDAAARAMIDARV
jgi:8-oxo-dGTP pyrophosphatase MutT (NUDIX family)